MGRNTQHTASLASKRGGGPAAISTPTSNLPSGKGMPASQQHPHTSTTTASSPASALTAEYIDFAALVEEVQGNVISEKRLLPRSWFGRVVLCGFVSLSLMLLKETAFRSTRLESADISMHLNIQEACRRSNSLQSEDCLAHQYNLARKATFGSSAFDKVHEALFGKLAPVHVLVLPVFIIYMHLAGSGKTLAIPRKQAKGVIPTVIGMLRGIPISKGDARAGGPPPLVGPSTLPLAMSTSSWLPPSRGAVDLQDTIYNSDFTTHVVSAADGDFGCSRLSFLLEQLLFGHPIACLLIHFVSTVHVPDVSLCCLLAAARLFTTQTSLSTWFNPSSSSSGGKRSSRSRRPKVTTKNVIEWIAWATLFAFLFFPHPDVPSTHTSETNFQIGDGEGVDSAKILGSDAAAALYAGGLKVASRKDTPPAPTNRYAFHWTVINAHLPLVPIVVPTHLLEYTIGLFGRPRRLPNVASSSTSNLNAMMAANEIIMDKYYPAVKLLSSCGPSHFSTFQRHILALSDKNVFKRAESDPRLASPFLLRGGKATSANNNKAKKSKNQQQQQPPMTPDVEAALDACSPHRGGSPPLLLLEAFVVDEWQSTTIWGSMMWYSLTFSIVYCIRMSGFAVDSRAWLATTIQHNGIRGAKGALHWLLSFLYPKSGGTAIAAAANKHAALIAPLQAVLWGSLQILIFTCTLAVTILLRVGIPVAVYMYICAIEKGIAIPWPTSSMVVLTTGEESLVYPRVTALGGSIPLIKLLMLMMIGYGFGFMQFINDGIPSSSTISFNAAKKFLYGGDCGSSTTTNNNSGRSFIAQHPCSVLAILNYTLVTVAAIAVMFGGTVSPYFASLIPPIGSIGVDLMVGHMVSSRVVGLLDYAIVSMVGTDVWWGYSSISGQKRIAPHATAPTPAFTTVCTYWLSWCLRIAVIATVYISGFAFVFLAHNPATHFIVPSALTDTQHATYTQRLLSTIPDAFCAAATFLFISGLGSRAIVRVMFWVSLRSQEQTNLPGRIADAEVAAQLLQQYQQHEQAKNATKTTPTPVAPVTVIPPTQVEEVAPAPTVIEKPRREPVFPLPTTATVPEADSADSTPSTTPTSINGSYRNNTMPVEIGAAASSSTTPIPMEGTTTAAMVVEKEPVQESAANIANGKKKRRQERKEAAERERLIEEAKKEQERIEKLEHQRQVKERRERERQLEEEEAEAVRRVEEERKFREETVRRAEEEQQKEHEEFIKKQEAAALAKASTKIAPKQNVVPKALPPTATSAVTTPTTTAKGATTPNSSRGAPMSIDVDETTSRKTTATGGESTVVTASIDDTKVTVAIPLPASKNKQRQEQALLHQRQEDKPASGGDNSGVKHPSNKASSVQSPVVMPPRPMFEEEDFSTPELPHTTTATGKTAVAATASSKKVLDPVSAAIAGAWGKAPVAPSVVASVAVENDTPLPTLPPLSSNTTTKGSAKGSTITASTTTNQKDIGISSPAATSPALNPTLVTPGSSPLKKPADFTIVTSSGRTGILPLMAPLPAGQRSYASAVGSSAAAATAGGGGRKDSGGAPPIGITPPAGSLADSSSFCSNNIGGGSFTFVSAKERLRGTGSTSTNAPHSGKNSSTCGSPTKGGITGNKSGSFRFAPGALGASTSSLDEDEEDNTEESAGGSLPPKYSSLTPNPKLQKPVVVKASSPNKQRSSGGIAPIGAVDDDSVDAFDGLPSLPATTTTGTVNSHLLNVPQKNGGGGWTLSHDEHNRPRSASSYSAGSVKTQDDLVISIQVADDSQFNNTVGEQEHSRAPSFSTANPGSPTTLHQQFDDLLGSFPTNYGNNNNTSNPATIDGDIAPAADPQYTPFSTPGRGGGGLQDPFSTRPSTGGGAVAPTASGIPIKLEASMSSDDDDSLSSALFADVQGGDDDDDLPTDIWGTGTAAPQNAIYNHVIQDDDDGFVVESGGTTTTSVSQPPTLQASAAEFLPRRFESPNPVGSQSTQQPMTPNQCGPSMHMPPGPPPHPHHHLQQQLPVPHQQQQQQQQQVYVVEQKYVYLQHAVTGEQQQRLMMMYSNGQTVYHSVVFAQQPTGGGGSINGVGINNQQATPNYYPNQQVMHVSDQQHQQQPVYIPSNGSLPPLSMHHTAQQQQQQPHGPIPQYSDYMHNNSNTSSANGSPEARIRPNNNNIRQHLPSGSPLGGSSTSSMPRHSAANSSSAPPLPVHPRRYVVNNNGGGANNSGMLSASASSTSISGTFPNFHREEMGNMMQTHHHSESPVNGGAESGRDSVVSIVVGTPGHQSYHRTVSNNPTSGGTSPGVGAHITPTMSRTQSRTSPTQIKVAGKIVSAPPGMFDNMNIPSPEAKQ